MDAIASKTLQGLVVEAVALDGWLLHVLPQELPPVVHADAHGMKVLAWNQPGDAEVRGCQDYAFDDPRPIRLASDWVQEEVEDQWLEPNRALMDDEICVTMYGPGQPCNEHLRLLQLRLLTPQTEINKTNADNRGDQVTKESPSAPIHRWYPHVSQSRRHSWMRP